MFEAQEKTEALAEAYGQILGVRHMEKGKAGDHLTQSLEVFPDSENRGLSKHSGYILSFNHFYKSGR